MSSTTHLPRTLNELARALHAVKAGPVAWAGPGGEAYYRLTGHGYPELEELSDGSGSDAEMLASALGWVYARRLEGLEGPLVVVVEDELGPGFAQALSSVAAREEPVLVILADLGRRYLSAVKTGWGFLSRESSQASLEGFVESLGIRFLGTQDPRKPEKLEEVLGEALSASEGTRLLHLVGQPAEHSSQDDDPRADQYHLSRPPDRPAWTGPIQTRRAVPPDTLAQAVLARLASELEPQAVVYWTVPDAPGPLAIVLGERCLRRNLSEVLAEARGASRGGLMPYVVLSARRLPEVFSQYLEGVDFPATLIVLDGGLTPMAQGLPPHPASLRDLAMLRMIPNLVLAAPADEEEARRILVGARGHQGPLALRFTAAPAVGMESQAPPRPTPPGHGRQLRKGRSVALLGAGSTVFPCVLAAETLAAWGVQAAVYDLRWIQPLDEDLLLQALECGRLVTVEEHLAGGGAGTAVLEALQRLGKSTIPTLSLALPQEAADQPASGLEAYELSAEGIAVSVRKFLGMGEGL